MFAATSRLSLFIVLMLLPPFVAAGNFSDKFRTFIVGDSAEASSQYTARSLDAVSQQCMNCHYGNNGHPIEMRPTGRVAIVHGNRTTNHPVGMRYDDAHRRDRHGYRARAQLSPKLLLVNGLVGCASCHQTEPRKTQSVAASEVALLTPPGCTSSNKMVTGSKPDDLCMACHTK